MRQTFRRFEERSVAKPYRSGITAALLWAGVGGYFFVSGRGPRIVVVLYGLVGYLFGSYVATRWPTVRRERLP